MGLKKEQHFINIPNNNNNNNFQKGLTRASKFWDSILHCGKRETTLQPQKERKYGHSIQSVHGEKADTFFESTMLFLAQKMRWKGLLVVTTSDNVVKWWSGIDVLKWKSGFWKWVWCENWVLWGNSEGERESRLRLWKWDSDNIKLYRQIRFLHRRFTGFVRYLLSLSFLVCCFLLLSSSYASFLS